MIDIVLKIMSAADLGGFSNRTECIPHLAPQEPHALDHRVREAIERDGVWPTWIVGRVGLLADEAVPVIAIPIEGAVAVPV